MGSKVNFSAPLEPFLAGQGSIQNSLLHSTPDPESSGDFSRFPGPANRAEIWSGAPENDAGLHFMLGSYSAAA